MRDVLLIIGLIIAGLFVDTLEGWPLTIAALIAVAVVAVGLIAYKQGSNK